MSGPMVCLAWAYWPPAAGMVDVISELIMTSDVYNSPTTHAAMSEPYIPPFSTVKFHPMNSPTSTIPTPSAQMWTGDKTLSNDRCSSWRAWPGAASCIATSPCPLRRPPERGRSPRPWSGSPRRTHAPPGRGPRPSRGLSPRSRPTRLSPTLPIRSRPTPFRRAELLLYHLSVFLERELVHEGHVRDYDRRRDDQGQHAEGILVRAGPIGSDRVVYRLPVDHAGVDHLLELLLLRRGDRQLGDGPGPRRLTPRSTAGLQAEDVGADEEREDQGHRHGRRRHRRPHGEVGEQQHDPHRHGETHSDHPVLTRHGIDPGPYGLGRRTLGLGSYRPCHISPLPRPHP